MWGKNVAGKESLFKQKVMDTEYCYNVEMLKDSYGEVHTNGIYFSYNHWPGRIIYVLNRKFAYLQLKISVCDSARLYHKGKLIIKADEEVVYTCDDLTKTTEPFIVSDIVINNCMLLTIEYTPDYEVDCIISDAILYN